MDLCVSQWTVCPLGEALTISLHRSSSRLEAAQSRWHAAQQLLVEKDARIALLEAAGATLKGKHAVEVEQLRQKHHEDLTTKEKRIVELELEVTRIKKGFKTELESARATHDSFDRQSSVSHGFLS